MTLSSVDKKWVEGKIVDGVLEGIHKVGMPALERLDGKIDRNAEKIDNLEVSLGNIERKLDRVLDHQTGRLDEYRDRLGSLESRIGLNVI